MDNSQLPEILRVRAWNDLNIDRYGVEVRSTYTERFWAPLIGPSATLLIRYFADRLDESPDGFELDTAQAAQRLGLSDKTIPTAIFPRTVGRLMIFRAAMAQGEFFLVRRYLPTLHPKQLARLPIALQHEHEDWIKVRNLEQVNSDRQCSAVLLALLNSGESAQGAERTAIKSGFHPARVEVILRQLADSAVQEVMPAS